MTANEFISQIEEYYYKYPKNQLPVIRKYLSSKSSQYLRLLYKYTILNFSSSYKVAPDVAIFNQQYPHIKKEMLDNSLEQTTQEMKSEDFVSYEERMENIKKIGNIFADLKQKMRVK